MGEGKGKEAGWKKKSMQFFWQSPSFSKRENEGGLEPEEVQGKLARLLETCVKEFPCLWTGFTTKIPLVFTTKSPRSQSFLPLCKCWLIHWVRPLLRGKQFRLAQSIPGACPHSRSARWLQQSSNTGKPCPSCSQRRQARTPQRNCSNSINFL